MPPPPDRTVFEMRFTPAAGDIDELGHVNNAVWVQWIQDVAGAHWYSAVSAEDQAAHVWVVVRHEIDYRKPAFGDEEVTVTTWVGQWTAVTCERFTEIRRGNDLLVQGRTIWCMCDRESERPKRIAKELIDRFSK